jgi:hypothetical protein
MEVCIQRHAPAALLPIIIRYPSYRRLKGSQCRSSRTRKIPPATGFDPQTVHSVTSCCTNYATPTRIFQTCFKIKFPYFFGCVKTVIINSLKYSRVYKYSLSTSQKAQRVTISTTNCVMLFRKICYLLREWYTPRRSSERTKFTGRK